MLLVFFVHFALNPAYGQESGQQVSGPYTIARIGDDVYNIQDANAQNPPGVHKGENGEEEGMNNCSDMYLILGTEKALLIDLSNRIEWYEEPADWLRKIIYEKIGNRQLIITVTHNHGDHLGMLPAFVNDPKAEFWIPMKTFPRNKLFFRQKGPFISVKALCWTWGAKPSLKLIPCPDIHRDPPCSSLKMKILYLQVMQWVPAEVCGFLIMTVLIFFAEASVLLWNT